MSAANTPAQEYAGLSNVTHEKILAVKAWLPSIMVMTSTSDDINKILLSQMVEAIEGRIRDEGWIVPGTLELVSRSTGYMPDSETSDKIIQNLELRCLQVIVGEGDVVRCKVKTVSNFGITAQSTDASEAVMLTALRELHHGAEEYERVKEGDTIDIVVLEAVMRMEATKIEAVGVLPGFEN